MRTKSFLGTVILLLVVSISWADRGGWVGTGGEIFRFNRNPWFVKNVKTVRYCLQMDQATISADAATVRKSFRDAVDYWKKEFSSSSTRQAPGLVQLATQDFEEGPCSKETELVLKVGYGTLDQDEIDEMKKPENYIGISIRKNYDLATMKGDGIIYISSDLGEHAYKNNGQLILKAWEHSKLLTYAFAHELGHIFGISHTGTGLMAETFLEQLLSKRMSPFYLKHPMAPFFTAPKDFEICSFTGTFDLAFFQLKETTACLVLKADGDLTTPRWKVFAKKYTDSDPVEIGMVQLDSPTAKVNGAKPFVTLQLPDEQQVFPPSDRGFASFLLGGILQEFDYQGGFRTKNSLKPSPLFASLTPDSITFVAAKEGRLNPVMVYSPPTLLRMLLPIETTPARPTKK